MTPREERAPLLAATLDLSPDKYEAILGFMDCPGPSTTALIYDGCLCNDPTVMVCSSRRREAAPPLRTGRPPPQGS